MWLIKKQNADLISKSHLIVYLSILIVIKIKKFGYFGLKLLFITFFLARQFGKLEMLAEWNSFKIIFSLSYSAEQFLRFTDEKCKFMSWTFKISYTP